MIRFIYIGKQIGGTNEPPDERDFAFWDTVTDSFCYITDTCLFHSVEDFEDAVAAGFDDEKFVKRLRQLIPPWYIAEYPAPIWDY